MVKVWSIAAPGNYYLSVRHLGIYELHWQTDLYNALIFRSIEQADEFACAIKTLRPELFAFSAVLQDAQIVEHDLLGE